MRDRTSQPERSAHGQHPVREGAGREELAQRAGAVEQRARLIAVIEVPLDTLVPEAGVIGPVAVKPGESIEMKKWNFAVTGDHFFVFQPVAAQPAWKVIADVTFNVRNLPTSTTAEISATVRVTANASGIVTAVSERPDVIEIVSVTPQ